MSRVLVYLHRQHRYPQFENECVSQQIVTEGVSAFSTIQREDVRVWHLQLVKQAEQSSMLCHFYENHSNQRDAIKSAVHKTNPIIGFCVWIYKNPKF